jgi:hypothetical protein
MENSAIGVMHAIFYALGLLIIKKNQRFADLKIFIFTPDSQYTADNVTEPVNGDMKVLRPMRCK